MKCSFTRQLFAIVAFAFIFAQSALGDSHDMMLIKNESEHEVMVHPLSDKPTKFDPKDIDPGQSVSVVRPEGRTCVVIVKPTILGELQYPCAETVIIKKEHIELFLSRQR